MSKVTKLSGLLGYDDDDDDDGILSLLSGQGEKKSLLSSFSHLVLI